MKDAGGDNFREEDVDASLATMWREMEEQDKEEYNGEGGGRGTARVAPHVFF